MKRALAFSLLLMGCPAPMGPPGGEEDMTSRDLSRPADLSEGPDLSQRPDMTVMVVTPPDMTAAPDLTPVILDFAGADLIGVDLTGFDFRPAPDLAGTTPVAWGMPCNVTTSACQGGANETGYCAAGFGTPLCLETCNNLPDYALCRNEKGICVPIYDDDGVTLIERDCLPKCGDAENASCGAGASCAHIGYRDRPIDMGAPSRFVKVGACVPDCAQGGADACMAAGRTCEPACASARRTTAPPAARPAAPARTARATRPRPSTSTARARPAPPTPTAA
jgi:hypothetical protein